VNGRLKKAGLIFAGWAKAPLRRVHRTQSALEDGGHTCALLTLQIRLHWGGMLCNAVQLVAIVGAIPYIVVAST
jgi:hypothetical protein